MSYAEFLASKAFRAPASGLTVSNEAIHPMLYPFQRDLVRWAVRKGRAALFAAFASTPWRLACTATPAPNDIEELCNHAHFLDVMTPAEMRSTFFIADSRGEFMRYRLKRHARTAFYRWLASWAMAVKRPS